MAKRRKKTPTGVRRRERADGTVVFFAVVKINGRQIYGAFRDDPDAAHKDYLRIKADPETSIVTVGDRKRVTASKVTLRKALDAVVEYKRSKGAANDRTLNTARINVRAILNLVAGEFPIRDIDATHLNEFIRRAERKGYSTRSIKEKYLQLLKKAFEIQKIPWPDNVRSVRFAKREMDFFTPEELKELLRCVRVGVFETPLQSREVHAALFEFLARTGCRAGELGRITVKDIDRKKLRVRLTNNKDAGSLRHIPFTQDFLPSLDILTERAGVDAKICPGGERYLSTACARWKERLDEPRLSGRTLRHTFVTSLLIAGVDPYTVMELAGHTSLATTMKYVHLVSPHKRDAAEKLGKLFKDD